jgi:hypothetical protein
VAAVRIIGGLENRTFERIADLALPLAGTPLDDFLAGVAIVGLLAEDVGIGSIMRARTSSASMYVAPLAITPRESVTRAEALFQSLSIT